MILKTRITNNLKAGRTIGWAGLYLGPGQSEVVEGTYPSIIRSKQDVPSFFHEVENKSVSLTLITDMNVEYVGEKAAQMCSPTLPGFEAISESIVETPAVTVDVKVVEAPVEESPMFNVGSIDEQKAEPVQAFGEIVEPKEIVEFGKSPTQEVIQTVGQPKRRRSKKEQVNV